MRFLRSSVGWLVARGESLAVPALIIASIGAVLFLAGPRFQGETASHEVWTCSMHPQVRLNEPGRCPICGMTLIPLTQFASEQVRVAQQAGLETEVVRRRDLIKEIRTVGKLEYNERLVAYITARVDGRVDRVFADFVGVTVKTADHLVEIYSPALVTTQAELLRALEALPTATGDKRLATAHVEAARTKLKLLGILPEQIARIEKTREESPHVTLYAPIGGVVIEKNVREQQYVKEGDMLYRIAELDPIWLYLDIYEYDLGWIRYGQSVNVAVEAYPGEVFQGVVVFVDPFLSDAARAVKVRVNLKNPGHRLKPAMYASAIIRVRLQADGTPEPTPLEGKYACPMHLEFTSDEPGRCSICDMPLEHFPNLFPLRTRQPPLPTTDEPMDGPPIAVRKSAVLDTGRRQVVYRQRANGNYELVEVKLGPLAEGDDDQGKNVSYFPVLSGLQVGDRVVVQGGFLLDSQRQIEGMPSLLYEQGRSAANLHAGHGGAPPTTTPPAPAPDHSGAPAGHQH